MERVLQSWSKETDMHGMEISVHAVHLTYLYNYCNRWKYSTSSRKSFESRARDGQTNIKLPYLIIVIVVESEVPIVRVWIGEDNEIQDQEGGMDTYFKSQTFNLPMCNIDENNIVHVPAV